MPCGRRPIDSATQLIGGRIGGVELTAMQARVLACLMEKAATTPDSYPLTTNSLVTACNQSTNRSPVVAYTDRDVNSTMIELRQLELARMVTGGSSRASKHKHVVAESLGLTGAEVAILAVLTLRGPQTINEIVTRTERYDDGPNGDLTTVDAAIDALSTRETPLVRRLDRRPGEREPRIEQRWQPATNDDRPHDGVVAAGSTVGDEAVNAAPADDRAEDRSHDLAERVAALEAALARQTRRIDALMEELGVDKG